MSHPAKSPLDDWARRLVGRPGNAPLDRASLEAYQLRRLNQTLALINRTRAATGGSPYMVRPPFGKTSEVLFGKTYKVLETSEVSVETSEVSSTLALIHRARRHSALSPHHSVLTTLSDLKRLPYTSAEDIRRDPMAFWCVSQDRIARIVTLTTSGTTHAPKRIGFTEADLERTIDFFHYGMATLVRPGERVLILLPGDQPDSVGDLLVRALARMDVTGIAHGPVRDPEITLAEIADREIDGIVGIPVQVLALARHPGGAEIGRGRVRTVLLTTDHVPRSIVTAIETTWGCRVFQHYGMTEMGLGGGVECEARSGYHLREADLLFEIIDPDRPDGPPPPEGEVGEVVFTTLTRTGMPLIRYRTGDLAAFIPDPCPCGSVLKQMTPVRRRRGTGAQLGPDRTLHLADLDEALFALPGVIDFEARVRPWREDRPAGAELTLTLRMAPSHPPPDLGEVRRAVEVAAGGTTDRRADTGDCPDNRRGDRDLRGFQSLGNLGGLQIRVADPAETWPAGSTGRAKRKLIHV